MNIVVKLMAFRDSQDIAQLGMDKCIDIENLNVIVIEILSWLKLQHKRELWIAQGRKTKLKSMDLNFEFPWCNELESYIKANYIFGEYFIIEDKTMDFKDDIPLDYILTARKLAYELYNPEKIV
ncbi:MAG: hypothetical protein K6G19_12080 [Lachnospiraceae bacterium]|nr:hypothetical protein [Lachnospiraceae bacterium]